jgi:hypothetical protein
LTDDCLFRQPCDGTSNLLCLACLEGNLQRVYTNQELNMQLDYYNFMFSVHSFESLEGEWIGSEYFTGFSEDLSGNSHWDCLEASKELPDKL